MRTLKGFGVISSIALFVFCMHVFAEGLKVMFITYPWTLSVVSVLFFGGLTWFLSYLIGFWFEED